MKPNSRNFRVLGFVLPALLMVTTSLTVRAQQPSFTVEGIRPYDKAVPGQVLEVLFEGLGSLDSPMILPDLNPLRGEQTGMSAPVPLEIVDDVFPPVLTSVSEASDADLARLKQMYETQKQAGREFPEYDPSRRYLTVKVKGVDSTRTSSASRSSKAAKSTNSRSRTSRRTQAKP